MDPKHLLLGSTSSITALCVDSKWKLISGSENGILALWSLKTHRPIKQHQAHEKYVLAIHYLEHSGLCVSQGRDGFIRFWKIDDESFSFSEGMSPIMTNSLSFCRLSLWCEEDLTNTTSPNTRFAHVSAETDEPIEVVHFPTNTVQFLLLPVAKFKLGLCMTLYGFTGTLLAAYESGHVICFDLKPGNHGRQLSLEQLCDNAIMCMAYNPCIDRGAVGSAESDFLILFTLNEDKKLSILNRLPLTNQGLACLTWRLDGRLLASGGWDGRVRLFSAAAKRPKLLAVLDWSGVASMPSQDKEARLTVQCALFTVDNYLITGAADRTICVWDVYR